MVLISIEQVWKRYTLGENGVLALKGVDLAIQQGEFIALWGPSGSGKSTLCHMIGAIDTPTSGRVQIGGCDMATLSDDQRSEHRNRNIGFVFQGFNLIRVLSALENVMMPLRLRNQCDREARGHALVLLDELGLSAHVNQRPDRLSGGQQQRVAIARALVTRPKVVIADEPTANLDSENAIRIADLMRSLNRSHGTTFIFATHDQRLLEHVDRQVRLEDGRVAEDRRKGR
jgi:putative ABC transport system ATP-binding protein